VRYSDPLNFRFLIDFSSSLLYFRVVVVQMIVRQCTVSVVETVSDAGMIRYVWLSDVTLITTCLQNFEELVKITT
jgi:hypothetical protein